MDKKWMELPNRFSDQYRDGVKAFLDFAYSNVSIGGKIRCPCLKCNNFYKHTRELVEQHLIINGIVRSYNRWIHHGEPLELHNDDEYSDDELEPQIQNNEEAHDNIGDMLDDIFSGPYGEDFGEVRSASQNNGEAEKFLKLTRDAEKELYPGCQKFSKLSFLVKLLHIMSMNNWSQKSFDMLLQIFKEVLPDGSNVPKSFYEAKKVLRDLGLNYVKIDACKNHCCLFWGPNEDKVMCPTCEEPRWKSKKANGKTIPHKILRYFPIKPRLQRLFLNKDIASDMRWHKDKHVEEANVMRHPADGKAWKEFDKIHESFARDSRNIRLALSSDGFNPYSIMSTTYSMWPVVLVTYNLPPWKSMKQPFFLLSLLIPGSKSPGNDIDVFLQPLIKDLKELWEVGVDTYDALSKETFLLRAALLWTISDFPAYANLSGWSTKGKLACPLCKKETSSMRLSNGFKTCYMCHRRFLPSNHKWRQNMSSFDGTKERRLPPKEVSGDDVLSQLEKIRPVIFGKSKKGTWKRKRETYELNWTKSVIFFTLPYWKTLLLPHNLDVMHIEKNLAEAILATLLNIEGKTKDTIKSRLDLKKMGIRPELHPIIKGDKLVMPPACYIMSTDEKRSMCEFWESIKLPDGYASNISRCVNVKEGQLTGMKSHDYHVFLQRLLPLAIRGYLPKEACEPLFELGIFFQELCSKTLKIDILERLEKGLALTLCKLERIFPPSFFDIMVHLPIHLAKEAILGGPVQNRWMYPFERYMHTLKQYVGNKAHPEGSIAESYIFNECLIFCSMYLRGVETRLDREERNFDGDDRREGLSVFSYNGRLLGKKDYLTMTLAEWNKAHLYVLDNCDETQVFIEEHKNSLRAESMLNVDKRHAERFPKWFEERVRQLEHQIPNQVSKQLRTLSWAPSRRAMHFKRCIINGYRFHTKDHERYRKTQNSGILVVSEHEGSEIDFYGVLNEIIELEYQEGNRVVLFKCDWWNLGSKRGVSGVRKDNYEFISVNTAHTWYNDQPYIFASQAGQVYYVPDIKLGNAWKVVVKNTPRDNYDFPEVLDEEELNGDDEPYQQNVTGVVRESMEADNNCIQLRRFDIPAMEFDNSSHKRARLDHDGDDDFINVDALDEDDMLSEDMGSDNNDEDDDMFV